MKKFFTVFIILFTVNIVLGQNNPPCASPETEQLDFWIGEWKVEWTDEDGISKYGTNTITKILGSCVIKEQFNGNPGTSLVGRSYSVYNNYTGIWYQTWVDNNGTYLSFTGGKDGDNFIFSREYRNAQGEQIMQRMVFKDIKENSLVWDWQMSKDGGKSWTSTWVLNYSRITD